jgi:hypothetical protein
MIPTQAIQYPTWTNIASPTPSAVIYPSFWDFIAFLTTTIISGPGEMAARRVMDARMMISDIIKKMKKIEEL